MNYKPNKKKLRYNSNKPERDYREGLSPAALLKLDSKEDKKEEPEEEEPEKESEEEYLERMMSYKKYIEDANAKDEAVKDRKRAQRQKFKRLRDEYISTLSEHDSRGRKK